MIVTLVSIVAFIACLIWRLSLPQDADAVWVILLLGLTGVNLLIWIIAIIVVHWPWQQVKELAIMQAKREAIIFNLKHDIHPGSSVEQFNTDLAYLQTARKNPWESWFIAKWVMEVEPIPTDEIYVSIGKSAEEHLSQPTLGELLEELKQYNRNRS